MSGASEAIRVASPAPIVDVLEIAGPNRRLRRFVAYQARLSETVAVYRGDRILAVATLFPEGPHVRELCLMFDPAARSSMHRLIRIAQLMIRPLVDSGVVVVARIQARRSAGRRMAAAAGFVETDAEGGRLWIWRG